MHSRTSVDHLHDLAWLRHRNQNCDMRHRGEVPAVSCTVVPAQPGALHMDSAGMGWPSVHLLRLVVHLVTCLDFSTLLHLLLFHLPSSLCVHHLVGLVVKASASRAEDPGFESRLRLDFFGVESYQ